MFKEKLAKSLMLIFIVFSVSAQRTYSEELPDPTRPLEYKSEKVLQSALILQSVLVAGDRKVAVINQRQLTESQWIGGLQVTKISRDRVWLKGKDQTRVLRLHASDVKQSQNKQLAIGIQ